jgi:hypothetical protein
MAPLLHDSELSPCGIAATAEQLAWTKARKRPNRCIFSTTARRIVIRPDHFCGWTATWIGRRNHKFFILFNAWGFVYMVALLACDVNRVVRDLADAEPSPILALLLLYGMLGLVFAPMTGGFAAAHFCAMLENRTSWETWNGISAKRFDRGCLKNAEELCGPSSSWDLWPCPMSPRAGVPNEELIAGYPPYREDDAVEATAK